MELKFYKSPLRSMVLLLGSAVFVAAGAFILYKEGGRSWMGWLVVSFFGLGVLTAVYNMLDRRPQIIINEAGLIAKNTHNELISWDLIKDAYPMTVEQTTFVCLVVNEEFEPSVKSGKLAQRIASFNKALGAQEFNLNVSSVGLDPGRVCHFIKQMVNCTKGERMNVFLKGIPALR